MNLPEFGVHRPITNVMIFCGVMIVSLYSLSRLGVDMMPEIEPPNITVSSSYPGANPEDVETRVTEPLENQLASTPGLDKITSSSAQGQSRITLKFRWGVNLDEATNDIRDRIDRAKRFLPDIPDEMETPFIFKFNTSLMPILLVGITADQSYPDLYEWVDRRLGDPLRQIPGVGAVVVRGGLQRQISVWIDPERLDGHGFSILDVQTALGLENVTQPVGNIKSGLTDYALRLPGEFKSPEEIRSAVLGRKGDRLVYLKDVATVEDGFQEATDIVRINRQRGLIMIVQRQTGVNTVRVAKQITARLRELESSLPPDARIHVIMDSSQEIVDSLASLRSTVWSGSIFVILVTWFFLRRFKPSLIIALTIPFSLLISFIYLFLSERTINVISLTSITIAVGMVVDNAIVVVDNIIRHVERGQRPTEAAIFGTREMFLSVAASTGTTVAVFLPLLFVPGLVGIMFNELAVIVTVTLLASLFASSTLCPMLCSRFLRTQGPATGPGPKKAGVAETVYGTLERAFLALESAYVRLLNACLNHRATVMALAVLAFGGSLTLIPMIGTEFVPEQDSGDLRVTAHLPVGTRMEETDKLAERAERIMETDIPECRVASVRIVQESGGGFGGSAGSHVLSANARLVRKEERSRSSRAIAQAIRQKIRLLPGVFKTDVSTGNPMGRLITGTGGKAVQIEVAGNDFDETDEAAARIRAAMESTPGAVDVSVSREQRRPELQVRVDRAKAAALGLTMTAITDTLRTAITGTTASKYREGGESYDISVRVPESARSRPEDITRLSVKSSSSGRLIRLAGVAEVVESTSPVEIQRQNRERIVFVECNTHERSSGEVVADLRAALARMTFPGSVRVGIGGEAEEQSRSFSDLRLLLLLGIALVYMVMAAQFESFRDPFIVMFAVPFAFTGVILGFLITGTTLSVITYLGIVMLMGIVVNNAIVLISYIAILRARGMSVREAITTGGRQRLRPVLMTTLTTLAGLLPLAFSHGQGSETWQPLGITMVSGLVGSSLVTLVFIPTVYSLFEERRRTRATRGHA